MRTRQSLQRCHGDDSHHTIHAMIGKAELLTIRLMVVSETPTRHERIARANKADTTASEETYVTAEDWEPNQ